jgi:hypothetical protein
MQKICTIQWKLVIDYYTHIFYAISIIFLVLTAIFYR